MFAVANAAEITSRIGGNDTATSPSRHPLRVLIIPLSRHPTQSQRFLYSYTFPIDDINHM